MPIPAWPAVPYKPRRGEWKPTDPFLPPIETQFDGGNQRARRRPGDDIATVEQTIRMTPAEGATLMTFIRSTLVNGTLPFTMSVWSGTAYVSRTVEFTGKRPVPVPAGLKVAVAMTLRVWGGF